MKVCQWCGRKGTRNFRTWNNKPQCAEGVACAERSRKRKARGNGVRSGVRRRPASAVVRRLNTEALVAIGYDRPKAEKLTLPTLAVHFGLVGHGYEIHVFDRGKYIGAGARDFSGTHKIEDLKVSLMAAIEAAVHKWRSGL